MSARRQFAEDYGPPRKARASAELYCLPYAGRYRNARNAKDVQKFVMARRQRAGHLLRASSPVRYTSPTRQSAPRSREQAREAVRNFREKRDAATIMDVCAGAALPCRKRDAATDGNLKVLVGGWREALLRSGYSLWRSPDEADEHPSLHRDDHLGIRRRGDLGR